MVRTLQIYSGLGELDIWKLVNRNGTEYGISRAAKTIKSFSLKVNALIKFHHERACTDTLSYLFFTTKTLITFNNIMLQ